MKNIHVVKKENGWQAKEAVTRKELGTFATQAKAAFYATQIAKVYQTEVFVHGTNGRIRERNTFGNEPFPPKG